MSQHEFGPLPEGPLTVDTELKFNKLKLLLQRDLMRDYLNEIGIADDKTPEGIEATQAWVEKYSTPVRELFHKMIIENPHLKEDAEKIPDALYEEFKLRLYHDDTKINPEEYIDASDEMKEAA